jgi:succinate-semialdehyde dehydrogenase/glutarate-semialdehyde dehydrogenase
MASKFRNGGQTCVCPNRVYVQAAVHDRFVEKLARRVTALKVGPAPSADSQIGPDDQRARRRQDRAPRRADACAREGSVGGRARAIADGRTTRADGARATTADALARKRPSARSCACSASQRGRGSSLANDTPFGLAAYFYRSDIARVWRVAERWSGIVGINEGAHAAEAAPSAASRNRARREGSRTASTTTCTPSTLCQGVLHRPHETLQAALQRGEKR